MTVITSELILDHIAVYAREQVPFGIRANLTLEQFEDQILRSLIYTLRSYVLADTLQEEPVTVILKAKSPKTVWDHMKQDWFPTFSRWFGWKVMMIEHRRRETVTLKSMNTFPEASINYPRELGKPIKLQMLERDSGGWDV